jgi:hypothetical protein
MRTACTRSSPWSSTGDTRHPTLGAGRATLGKLGQVLYVLASGSIEPTGVGSGCRHLLSIHDHVDAVELGDVENLGLIERCLRRSAPPEQHDLAHPAVTERFERVGSDVCVGELFGLSDQDASHVHRDVAHADHHGAFRRQIEFFERKIRVTVVVADERGRGVAAFEPLARNSHVLVGRRTVGQQDLVVALAKLGDAEVLSDLDVSEQTKAWMLRGALEGGAHALDLLVIGGDTEADEPERRRKALENIDLDGELLLPEQPVGGVEPRRTRAHDGDPQAAPRRADRLLFGSRHFRAKSSEPQAGRYRGPGGTRSARLDARLSEP